ncbi:Hypothetical protein MVR_LOCUS177 [uncultured virus]|nr:Hypothetical protein MVR_LOCUS177 [uncultured virus]
MNSFYNKQPTLPMSTQPLVSTIDLIKSFDITTSHTANEPIDPNHKIILGYCIHNTLEKTPTNCNIIATILKLNKSNLEYMIEYNNTIITKLYHEYLIDNIPNIINCFNKIIEYINKLYINLKDMLDRKLVSVTYRRSVEHMWSLIGQVYETQVLKANAMDVNGAIGCIGILINYVKLHHFCNTPSSQLDVTVATIASFMTNQDITTGILESIYNNKLKCSKSLFKAFDLVLLQLCKMSKPLAHHSFFKSLLDYIGLKIMKLFDHQVFNQSAAYSAIYKTDYMRLLGMASRFAQHFANHALIAANVVAINKIVNVFKFNLFNNNKNKMTLTGSYNSSLHRIMILSPLDHPVLQSCAIPFVDLPSKLLMFLKCDQPPQTRASLIMHGNVKIGSINSSSTITISMPECVVLFSIQDRINTHKALASKFKSIESQLPQITASLLNMGLIVLQLDDMTTDTTSEAISPSTRYAINYSYIMPDKN